MVKRNGKDADGDRIMMLGNEAIARGAIEAGVQFAAAYPGTPATDILETLAGFSKEHKFHAAGYVRKYVPVRRSSFLVKELEFADTDHFWVPKRSSAGKDL